MQLVCLYIVRDEITANLQRIFFARVCIGVDFDAEIPKDIEVVMRDGRIVHVYTEVPLDASEMWKVQNIWPWRKKRCTKKEVTKWFPKKQEAVPEKVFETSIRGKEVAAVEAVTNDQISEADHIITSIDNQITLPAIRDSSSFAASASRFYALQNEIDTISGAEQRPSRLAAAGVKKVMESIMPRKQEDKNSKTARASPGSGNGSSK